MQTNTTRGTKGGETECPGRIAGDIVRQGGIGGSSDGGGTEALGVKIPRAIGFEVRAGWKRAADLGQ
jgi:hypothetical protein